MARMIFIQPSVAFTPCLIGQQFMNPAMDFTNTAKRDRKVMCHGYYDDWWMASLIHRNNIPTSSI